MEAPQLSPPIRALAEEIDARGGRLYLVGGGVRDHWMGLPVKDWDLEVFGIEPESLSKILRSRGAVNAVGRSFGVFKWTPHKTRSEIDVSIPRRDSKVGPGHKGIAVEGDPTMTIQQAAQRRDLTINALMWDVCRGHLEDPYGGLQDLEKGLLRAVDETTFLEDPLRALRVVQFAARLGFRPDGPLIDLCRRAPLGELPAERIAGEWGKMLLRGTHIALGFEIARETDVLARVFPAAAPLRPERALESLIPERRAAMDLEGRKWALMLATWLAGDPSAAIPTLDTLGIHTILNYPTRLRTLSALETLDAPLDSDAELRRWSTRAEILLAASVRGAVQHFDPHPLLQRAQAMNILTEPPAPLLLGRHLIALGIPPGPEMGKILAAIYELQIDGSITTTEQALERVRH